MIYSFSHFILQNEILIYCMKIRLIFLVSLVILSLIFLMLIETEFFINPPKFFSIQISGDSALDCGIVPICEDRTQANKCVLEAFIMRKPFFVWFYLPSIDSKLAVGYAGNKKGEIYRLAYDSDPTGGLKLRASIHHYKCKFPKIIDTDGVRRLNCEKNTNFTKFNLFSENFLCANKSMEQINGVRLD